MKRAALFILFIVTALSLASLHVVRAQETYKDEGGDTWYQAAHTGTGNNAQTTWSTGVQNLEYTGSYQILAQPSPPSQFPYNFRKSVLGYVTNTIGLVYATPPADLGAWIADTGQSLGFIPKQAYAQGIGFNGFLPLLPIWKVFRNIAYLLMAGVTIIIGFMIMFRKKIDPKTVVTAQNAIPRIIITLILITFSYAIVGFMIDVMYLVMALVAALFQSTGLLTNAAAETASGHLFTSMVNAAWNFNVLKIVLGTNAIPSWLNTTVGVLVGGVVAAVGALITIIPGANAVGAGVAIAGAAVAGLMPLIYIIYAIALLFLWIKLLVMFITAYIQIIISLLIGPLQLLAEGFPGSTAFSSWFKNLVANLAVFPVAAAMFMLSDIFVTLSNKPNGTIWAPPYVTPLSTSSMAIASVVSIGLLFAIEPVCKSIKEALKAKPPVSLASPGGALGGAWNTGMQGMSAAYYARSILHKDQPPDTTGGSSIQSTVKTGKAPTGEMGGHGEGI